MPNCLFHIEGLHVWRPAAGTYVVGHDHDLRICTLCGASGRMDKAGEVHVRWEPRMCGATTRIVEVPGRVTYYSCHRPEGHDGDHDETYPAVRR